MSLELRNDLMIHYKNKFPPLALFKKATWPSNYDRAGVCWIRLLTSRTDNFCLLSWFKCHVAKKREREIRKHLCKLLRVMLRVPCSHAALCYAVNHCYVYLETQTSGPIDACCLKLLSHLKT